MADEFCPRCGTKRLETFRFCRSCRFDFESVPADTPPAAQPAASAVLPAPAAPPKADQTPPPTDRDFVREAEPVESLPAASDSPQAPPGLSAESQALIEAAHRDATNFGVFQGYQVARNPVGFTGLRLTVTGIVNKKVSLAVSVRNNGDEPINAIEYEIFTATTKRDIKDFKIYSVGTTKTGFIYQISHGPSMRLVSPWIEVVEDLNAGETRSLVWQRQVGQAARVATTVAPRRIKRAGVWSQVVQVDPDAAIRARVAEIAAGKGVVGTAPPPAPVGPPATPAPLAPAAPVQSAGPEPAAAKKGGNPVVGLLAIVVIGVVIYFVANAGNSASTTGTGGQVPVAPAAPTSGAGVKVVALGQAERVSDQLQVTVENIQSPASVTSFGSTQTPPPGEAFLFVKVRYDSLQDGAPYSSGDWQVYANRQGIGPALILGDTPTPALVIGTISKGNFAEGWLYYEVPSGSQVALQYKANLFESTPTFEVDYTAP